MVFGWFLDYGCHVFKLTLMVNVVALTAFGGAFKRLRLFKMSSLVAVVGF